NWLLSRLTVMEGPPKARLLCPVTLVRHACLAAEEEPHRLSRVPRYQHRMDVALLRIPYKSVNGPWFTIVRGRWHAGTCEAGGPVRSHARGAPALSPRRGGGRPPGRWRAGVAPLSR